MSKNKASPQLGALLAGAALGAAATAAAAYWLSSSPQSTPAQQRRNRALDQALNRARSAGAALLLDGQKYVVFSDLHRGRRTAADEFPFGEAAYLEALEYYYQAGYTLVLLGDAEELWEETDIGAVMQAHAGVFESEARFHPQRYVRVVGNHDNAWKIQALVEQYLAPFFPAIQVRREFLLRVALQDGRTGEILMVHGHQGTLDSDIFDFIPQMLLPLYRDFQNLTHMGHTPPSKDACLRGMQDTFLYRWARSKNDLLLVAGHTHRPVWTSLTHLDKLLIELHYIQNHRQGRNAEERLQKLRELLAKIKEREQKYPPCNDTIKSSSCYFNTGCCVFEDGDITGIEIDGGRDSHDDKNGSPAEMRLVKWGKRAKNDPQAPAPIERTEMESQTLEDIFMRS
jgi:UDP-2,3-diacylglucosamine pyrophosphatase LpxH